MTRVLMAIMFVGCVSAPAPKPEPVAPSSPPPTPARAECPTTLPSLTERSDAFGSVIEKVCLIGAGDEKHLRLNEAIAPREGQPLDAAAVRDDLELLFTQGELKDVVVIAQPLDSKRVVLSYFVTEYPELTDVKVEGLSALKPEEVRDVIHAGLRASPQRLKRTTAELKDLYAEAGYPRASVDVALQGTVLRLSVSEGPHAVVRSVTFQGAKQLPEARLTGRLRLSKGATFVEDLKSVDERLITERYLESGFVDVRVEGASTVDSSGAVDLTWKVTEGSAFTVGRLSFKGLTFSTEKVVLKGFRTKPGALFSVGMVGPDIRYLEDLARRAGTPVTVIPITSVNREKRTIDVQFELERKE